MADRPEVLNRQGSAAVSPQGYSPPGQANLIRDFIREELRRGLGRRDHHSEREDSVSSSSSQEGSRSLHSRLSRHHSRAPSRSRHSRSPSRCLNHSRISSCSSHVLEGSSRSLTSSPPLSRHSSVVSPAHAYCRATPSATFSRAPPSPPLFILPLPPPYTSHSISASPASAPHSLMPFFPSMMRPPCYESPSPVPSVCSSSFVAVDAAVTCSHRLPPPCVSLRPSTVCPSGYRSRLLLGLSAGSRSPLFLGEGKALPLWGLAQLVSLRGLTLRIMTLVQRVGKLPRRLL